MQSSLDEKITALRHLVKDLNVKSEDIFIRYSRSLPKTGQQVYEYATALPIPRASLKRTANRAEKTAEGHCRWIVTQLEPVDNEPDFHADPFQKQTLEYHENMTHQGEDLFAKENEFINRGRENGGEIMYWYQPNRLLQPIPLTEQDITIDGWLRQGWYRETNPGWLNQEWYREMNPGAKFEMLYGGMQAAVFVACPYQFDPPPYKPQRLPLNAEWSGMHNCLLNQSLDSAIFLQACDRAFEFTGSDYIRSLHGFAAAIQLYMLMPDASIDVSIYATARSLSGATAKTFSDSNLRETAFSSTLAKVCKQFGCQLVPLIA